MNKEDEFGFTTHSLERGLERLFQYEAPYTDEQLARIEKFILHNIEWHPIREIWVLPDYNAELVIRNGSVVTVIVANRSAKYTQPITEYDKENYRKFRLQREKKYYE